MKYAEKLQADGSLYLDNFRNCLLYTSSYSPLLSVGETDTEGCSNKMCIRDSYKSRGPQYVRGMQEGNGIPKDSDMWVSYSMNKEDIWVAHVPVPVKTCLLYTSRCV